MKNKTLLLSLVALIALIITPMTANAQKHYNSDDGSYTERDEINQTYTLASGARVEVRGINGTVDIETAAGSTAEVHVVRLARNRDDLNYHKIFVEQTADGLVVRGEEKNHDHGEHQVRHQVTLRLPRQIDLGVSGVNGGVEIQFAEDLNADVEVTGINGRVNADVPNVTVMGKLERNNFRAKIGAGGTPIIVNGINGSVRLTRGGVTG